MVRCGCRGNISCRCTNFFVLAARANGLCITYDTNEGTVRKLNINKCFNLNDSISLYLSCREEIIKWLTKCSTSMHPIRYIKLSEREREHIEVRAGTYMIACVHQICFVFNYVSLTLHFTLPSRPISSSFMICTCGRKRLPTCERPISHNFSMD